MEQFGNSFAWAVEELGRGGKVCRAGWNGKGMWLERASLQTTDGRTVSPAVLISDPGGRLHAWNASQQDFSSEDWGKPS